MGRYNKEQKEYLSAKNKLEILVEKEKEIDCQYIDKHKIINSDGRIPTRSYLIEDDEIAAKAIKECGEFIVDSGLWAEILEAREGLRQEEDKLIEYALEIVAPHMKEKEILQKAVKENYTTRVKVLELIIDLDATLIEQ